MIDCNLVSKDKWESFGLHLGLHKPTLNGIMADKRDAEGCFIECLAKWLKRADDSGIPTRRKLVRALELIDEGAIAAALKIKCTEC